MWLTPWMAVCTALETRMVRVAAFAPFSTVQPPSSVTSAVPSPFASMAIPVSVTWS